ncbi:MULTISPECIES: hypothetical protein [unclassified Mesorhizobium]|uniref:hypothetical protein n=1 Tax=unclassified Mesorhizobium TaxID=325217 RepID=UPI0012DE6076|nr:MULTISPECIES: hypothetical protein [unclassified Mesorhizobium]WJI42619.1 hypothetical protein NL532_18220 [Mesorhizobium sp. C120A]WJI79014.1 hypothetical protein NLY34_19285 [Mesorhizobium sp. C374B]WJI85550.1 hypothetical protein NLY42_21685 [Mesorhizobium sp. C372A]
MIQISAHVSPGDHQGLEAADAILKALQAIMQVLVGRKNIDLAGDGGEPIAGGEYGLNVLWLLVDGIEAGNGRVDAVIGGQARQFGRRFLARGKFIQIGFAYCGALRILLNDSVYQRLRQLVGQGIVEDVEPDCERRALEVDGASDDPSVLGYLQPIGRQWVEISQLKPEVEIGADL